VPVHLHPIPTTKEAMLHFENEVHTLISKIKHACTNYKGMIELETIKRKKMATNEGKK
jgi:hypothetical protein